MGIGLLEIIALTVRDAAAAEAGGADRVEVARDMASDGLTPEPAVVAGMRAAVDIPLRVMVRPRAGFTVSGEELVDLVGSVRALRDAGAEEFVLGFLTGDGDVDLAATETVVAALDGAPWTFHRAIDHARDPAAAWWAISGLPGLDAVLTAGSAHGLGSGLPALAERTRWQESGVRLLAGGGLREDQIPELCGIGVTAVHAGSLVREGWESPVDPRRVRALREAVDSQLPGSG